MRQIDADELIRQIESFIERNAISKEDAKNRGLELIEDKYLIINGTLRLLSLTDEKWTELFSPYFEIESLEYFAWPGEKQETRRLFRLKRR